MKKKLFVRCLRKAHKMKFSVGVDGTKTYYDKEFDRKLGYASGQQVKRCIKEKMIEVLGIEDSLVEFLWKKDGKEDIVRTSANPNDFDQLLFGYMRTDINVTRTTSISTGGLIPIHPYLASTFKDTGTMDYTESDNAKIMISDLQSGGAVDLVSVIDKLDSKKLSSFKASKFLNPEVLINGLYYYDTEIDLDRMFSISLTRYKREIDLDTVDSLLENGWSYNSNKTKLVLNKENRDKIAEGVAEAIVDFELRSNKSRYYEPFTTFAMAVADTPRKLVEMINAEVIDDIDKTASLILRNLNGGLYTSIEVKKHINGVYDENQTIDKGIENITNIIKNYNHEN